MAQLIFDDYGLPIPQVWDDSTQQFRPVKGTIDGKTVVHAESLPLPDGAATEQKQNEILLQLNELIRGLTQPKRYKHTQIAFGQTVTNTTFSYTFTPEPWAKKAKIWFAVYSITYEGTGSVVLQVNEILPNNLGGNYFSTSTSAASIYTYPEIPLRSDLPIKISITANNATAAFNLNLMQYEAWW